MTFKTRYSRFGFRAMLAVVALAVLAGMVMLLWNAVVPVALAGARPIDYLHALGLLILSRILFGGFRGHGGWHARRRWGRWQAMTPEERAQFHRGTPSGGCPGPRE